MNRLLFILILVCSLPAFGGGPTDFPIIADVFHTKLYDQKRLGQIRNAGFNALLCHPEGAAEIKNVLTLAEQNDLKVILFSNTILDAPQSIVPHIKDFTSLWQYYLADEPKMQHLTELKAARQRISKLDSHAQCYINLFPNTGRELLEEIGVKTYSEYLQAFSTVVQPQISYDFYPIQGKVVRDDKWYPILDDIRKESLRTGRPFWAYVMCVPHFIYPMPTIEHLRLQCYVNLAYGAQGIQYFSYSTPAPIGHYDFHDGPLLRNGQLSKTYTLVKNMNKELRSVARLFYGSHVKSIKHKKCLNGNVLVSEFEKDGKTYTCYVNKSPYKPVTVDLNTNIYSKQILKSLKARKVKVSYSLPAGDIMIFQHK